MESELHRKIVLHQDVAIQNDEQPTIEGLNENGLVLLKLHSDIVTITPVMKEILDIARTLHTPEERSPLRINTDVKYLRHRQVMTKDFLVYIRKREMPKTLDKRVG